MIRLRVISQPAVKVNPAALPRTRLRAAGEKIVVSGEQLSKYEGAYEVIPKAFEPTQLDTKNKVLTDDIKVLEIPAFEVSNENGRTFYIASEVF